MNGDEGSEEEEAVEEDIPDEVDEVAIPDESLPAGTFIRALYDYIPQDFSPNQDVEDELAFQCQDVMKILEPMDDDGFYFVRLHTSVVFHLLPLLPNAHSHFSNIPHTHTPHTSLQCEHRATGRTGLVPSNFVEALREQPPVAPQTEQDKKKAGLFKGIRSKFAGK